MARLETRAVEVATLRERLRSRNNPDGKKAERLESELSATRTELVQARKRISELEGECRPRRRQAGMRDALTPLFERTLVPGGPGSVQ